MLQESFTWKCWWWEDRSSYQIVTQPPLICILCVIKWALWHNKLYHSSPDVGQWERVPSQVGFVQISPIHPILVSEFVYATPVSWGFEICLLPWKRKSSQPATWQSVHGKRHYHLLFVIFGNLYLHFCGMLGYIVRKTRAQLSSRSHSKITSPTMSCAAPDMIRFGLNQNKVSLVKLMKMSQLVLRINFKVVIGELNSAIDDDQLLRW